ncbi:MAG: hypothetical protein ACRETM_08285 [Stenotrophobium sp.]
MIRITSVLAVAILSLPLSAFAGSGTGSSFGNACSGSGCTAVDTAGLLATGAGENPGISMSFGNAINNAFNGNSGDENLADQSQKRKDKDTKDK